MSAAISRTSKKRQRSEPSAPAETAVPKANINEGSDDGEDRDEEEDGHVFEDDEDDDEVGDDDQNEEDEHDEGDDVAESSQAALKKAKTSGTSSAERRGKDKDKSQAKSKSKSKRKAPTPGIVYISRLPPGMTPQKVRHLMARWGEVGKVYAQRRDGYNPNSAAAKKQKQKHRQADFTEAWVEFLDKAMAKTVAQMLNAQVIGGKKGDRWRDDIWTMRYLSGFKWEMLGEQVAYEKQAHQARLRNEITQSKSAQDQYLRNVELARVLAKRQQKKVDAGGDVAAASTPGSASAGSQAKAVKGAAGKGQDEEGRKSGYRQREAVDRSKAGQGAGMDAVLSSIF